MTKIDLKKIIATRKVSNWYRSNFIVTLFDKFVYLLGLFCTFQFQIAVTRFLYNAGGRSSPWRVERKNFTCSKQTQIQKKTEEPMAS